MLLMKIKIRLLEPMLGTVPKNKEIYGDFIATKAPKEIDTDEEIKTVKELEEKGWTGFMEDENGIFIYNYMIKGFLKNAGNVLKADLKITALKKKITNFVFVYPRKIYFLNKTKPDGFLDRPLRSDFPEITTLVRSDFVDPGTELEFELKIYNNKEVGEEIIEKLLEYGRDCGLGQWRNAQYGSFEVVLIV